MLSPPIVSNNAARYANNDSSSDKPLSVVATDELFTVIANLENTFSALNTRLQRGLRASSPAIAENREPEHCAPCPLSSPLTESLRTATRRIDDLNAVIAEVLARLEL